MKKVVIVLVLVLLAVGVWRFWPQLKQSFRGAPRLVQELQSNSVVQHIKQQVLTGGALRGTQDSPDAFLTRAGVINYTNSARRQNGSLPALLENQKLDQDAQNKLNDMFARQYFEHVAPDGKGPSDQAAAVGYQYVIIGENLALGNFKNDAALVDAWMNSPGHRANILQPKYQEIGVAVGQGLFEGKKTWLAVQEFGRPLSSCPAIDQNLKAQIDSLKAEVDSLAPQLSQLQSQINALPDPQTQAQADQYNQQVANYNAMVRLYNNKVDLLKQNVAQYNSQVQAFNQCAE